MSALYRLVRHVRLNGNALRTQTVRSQPVFQTRHGAYFYYD